VESVGYYDIHKLQSYCSIKEGVKFSTLFKTLNEETFTSSLSHTSSRGLKTTLNFEELVEKIKKMK
jgi:tRNA G26 N,N-dimethylase Trm1